jgi:acetyl-CoA carboxylase biotin carboxylase subunit
MPGGHGVRLDTHGTQAILFRQIMIRWLQKLITTAQSREEAISKMRKSVRWICYWIKTTIPFHRQLMDDPRYISGDYTTAFMDTFKMIAPE